MQETWIGYLSQEDPPEEAIVNCAVHCVQYVHIVLQISGTFSSCSREPL